MRLVQLSQKNGMHFGVVIVTNHSHLGCTVDRSRVPAGFVPTGESIHSHGTDQRFVLNEADRKLIPSGSKVSLSASVRMVFSGQRLGEFSRQDYASGTGYLAAPGKLIHQDGVHRVSTIIEYDELSTQ